jgi:DNA polymerase alpha subunit B
LRAKDKKSLNLHNWLIDEVLSPTMAGEEIQSRFAPNGTLEPDVLSELQSMARLHDISAEDLYFKWESYCIKMDVDAQAITLSNVRGLKQGIQDELEKSQQRVQLKSERKMAPTPRSKAGGKGGDVFGMLDGLVPSTPSTGGRLHKLPGSGGSSLRKRMDMQKDIPSSPAAGLNEQLKSMNLPLVFSALITLVALQSLTGSA